MNVRWKILLSSLLLAGPAMGGEVEPLLRGLDHIPVVVADLNQAQTHYRAMGFALKPGRYHADGIQNAHVKFPDGTEIELITAPKPVDALTTEYRAKLEHSEGPVYFGLYAPDHATLTARLRAQGLTPEIGDGLLGFPAGNPLHPLFIGMREKSPTDRPEHFGHVNTAARLSALWVRDIPQFHALLARLEIPLRAKLACRPIGRSVTIATLPEGQIILDPNATADVMGARIEVRDISKTESVFEMNHIPEFRDPLCDPDSVWVPPSYAEGVWLQFAGVH